MTYLIEVEVLEYSERGVRVRPMPDAGHAMWFPRSVVTIESTTMHTWMCIPEWFLKKYQEGAKRTVVDGMHACGFVVPRALLPPPPPPVNPGVEYPDNWMGPAEIAERLAFD